MPKDVETSAISNATGPTQGGPDLATLLRGLSTGPAIEANQLQDAIRQLQGQEGPSLVQRLLSPAGLALAAGTVLAGKEAGASGALAFGAGGLQGLQGQTVTEREQRADAISQLQDQRDQALDRVEKAQQRVNNIFNTNPEAFIDPETGEPTIEPEELGLLATGFPVQLFPQTRRQMQNATTDKMARHDVFVKALGNSRSINDARQILRGMMGNMGWHDTPDEVVDALARSMGTPDWTPTLANIIAQNATNAPDVFIKAAENGLALEDPAVVSLVDWRTQPVELPTDAENKLLLIQQFNEWLLRNRDKAGKIREQSTDNTEFLQGAIDEAFADQPGSGQQLKVFLKVNEDNAAEIFESYQEFMKKHELAAQLSGYDEMESIRNMTDEERARYFMTGAIAMRDAKRQEILESQAKEDAKWQSNIKAQLRNEFPALGPLSVINITNKIFRVATEAARRPDGRIDRERFEETVRTELQKVRQDLQ